MPVLAQILDSIKNYINSQKAQNFTELPKGVKDGLSKSLKQDEEVLFTVRNFRAIYKAPRWVDSNTFFNSWFILTDQRIIIARNSSSFKGFRDISLNTISETDYVVENLESSLTIHSPGRVDTIEFLREARPYCEGLEEKVNEALEKVRGRENLPQTQEVLLCNECGSKVAIQSKFCPECGMKL